MIKSCISLGLVLSLAVVAYGFPQGGPPPPSALAGPPPNAPKCIPPPPPGYTGPPAQRPPGGENWPMCPPTLTSGTCGGKTYFWDTAKEDQPQEFKTCFFGDGEVGAICNGKEYSWDPAKQPKPTELEECEKNFAAKAAQ